MMVAGTGRVLVEVGLVLATAMEEEMVVERQAASVALEGAVEAEEVPNTQVAWARAMVGAVGAKVAAEEAGSAVPMAMGCMAMAALVVVCLAQVAAVATALERAAPAMVTGEVDMAAEGGVQAGAAYMEVAATALVALVEVAVEVREELVALAARAEAKVAVVTPVVAVVEAVGRNGKVPPR